MSLLGWHRHTPVGRVANQGRAESYERSILRDQLAPDAPPTGGTYDVGPMRSLAVALAAGVGCAGSPATPAPTPTVATVTLAAPELRADVAESGAPTADAAPDAAPEAAAHARAVRPGCSGPSLDLGTAQSACHCNLAAIMGPVDCPYDHDADAPRGKRDLRVSVEGATVAAGATVTLDVHLANGGTEDLPVLLIQDEHPRSELADAQGKPVTAIRDRSCPLWGALRAADLAVVVLPPGGTLSTRVDFAATRKRLVGPSYVPPNAKLTAEQRVLRALSDVDRPDGTDPCKEIPAGPLPRGSYTVEIRLPLWPEDVADALVARAAVQVK